MATFSTVSLMRETAEVVRRFAAYYHAAGAREILAYHDGPAPELRALALPGLVVVEADDAFWAGIPGGRPAELEKRQSRVYDHALERCRSDWLLVCDADEFVFGDRPIEHFLDAIPAAHASVAVPTAEAVWGPGDAIDTPFGSRHFRVVWRRRKLWDALGGAVYGRSVARNMQFGLAGHIVGKQFLRTDGRYSLIRNHHTEHDGARITRSAPTIDPSLAGMYVAHYDAIGLTRWQSKWRQRIERDTIAANMTPARQAQMRMIAEGFAAGDAPTRALFRAFNGLSAGQYAALSALGYAFRRDIFAPEG